MEPFVALMKKYCIDYTNSHDQSVCDEIMHPDYVVHISGVDLPRDAAYKPAARRVFDRFPGLGLDVHEFVTNGERLAMRFSEHGCSPEAGGNSAAWGGIGLYRWDGKQLLENYVEQDFLAQEAQLQSGEVAPLEPPHVDPWTSTGADASNPDAEGIARAWLAKGDLRAAHDVTIDGSWYGELAPSPIHVESVVVNDLFSAGDRVAFHISQTGSYTAGWPGVDDTLVGKTTTMNCVGFVTVEGGGVTRVRAITDQVGARAALRGKR